MYQKPLVEILRIDVASVVCESGDYSRNDYIVNGNDPVFEPEE